MQEQDIIDLAFDIGKAVCYLHEKRIAHRDIKPENIVLKKADTPSNRIYKLVDFGFVKNIGEDVNNHSKVGTHRYLPPQVYENKPYSLKLDYWSYGCVIFEGITGVVPFEEGTIHKAKEKSNNDICFFSNNFKQRIDRPTFPNFCSE